MNTSATKVISFDQTNFEEPVKRKSIALKPNLSRLVVHGFDCIDIIKFNKILYLHGEGNYCYIVKTNGEKILTSKTLKYFQEKLPNHMFFRSHKSYIVNLQHISKIHKKPSMEIELDGDVRIPTSRANKPIIFKLFN